MKYVKLPLLVIIFSSLVGFNLGAAPQNYLEAQLDERQERVEELGDEIQRLNKKVERKIDRLEKRFLSVKDSRESSVTVQQTKEKLINSLGELAKYYAEQRDLFLKEAHRTMPRADKETLERVAKAYDDHIDDIIERITRLNQSLASPHPDSKQGRDKQIARRTKEQREQTMAVLTSLIERLERENDEIRRRMKTMSQHDQESMREVIEHNESLIAKRTLQLESMEDAPQLNAKPISKSEALDLRKLLEASAQDIKEDCYRLSNLVIEYAMEEESVKRIQEQLGAQPDGESR